jgi:hypothetical protein
MRMNRPHTNQWLSKYDKDIMNVCNLCNALHDSLKHVINDCSHYQHERLMCERKIFEICNINNPNNTLKMVIGVVDEYDKKQKHSLLDVTATYLKNIMLHRKI